MTRTLPFATTFNFRDLGGYAGRDGRTVRWRRLFRSDSLHRLDQTDQQAFAALGVRTLIDLRRPVEVERHGRIPEVEGLDYRHFPVRHTDWDDVPIADDEPMDRWLAARYLNFVEEGSAELADSLRVIADPDAAPVVVHCMAGKDRTGVVCALTLSLLGVADADVAADYALSTGAMASLTAYLLDRRLIRPEDDKPYYFRCPAEAMLLFLAELRRRHGSVAGYVRDAGLSAAELAALRVHLLT